MFIRSELKKAAKEVLSRKYLTIFLATLFVILLSGGFISIQENYDLMTYELAGVTIKIFGIFGFNIGIYDPKLMSYIRIVGVLGLIWSLFVMMPIGYGLRKYYLKAYEGKEKFKNLFDGYKDGFGRVVMTIVLQNIYVVAWSLLFIIPGFVAAYRYRFVPYILAEYPELSPNEVIKKSKEMTNGIKWDIFVLDLSFILWHLLTLVTFGLSAFFVAPYVNMTDARLYLEVKEKMYGINDEVEVQDEEGNFI